jgi:hypothetical protein
MGITLKKVGKVPVKMHGSNKGETLLIIKKVQQSHNNGNVGSMGQLEQEVLTFFRLQPDDVVTDYVAKEAGWSDAMVPTTRQCNLMKR